MDKENAKNPATPQEFSLQWFKVQCDACGWSWFESEQMRNSRFFYCPKCLHKIANIRKKPLRLADSSEIASLKRHFDRIRLD